MILIETSSFGTGVYLAIVNTTFRSFFLSLSLLIAFHPLRGEPRKLNFMGTQIVTQLEGICKEINIYFFKFTEADFRGFLLLYTASVQSWPLGPTLVPGVFHVRILQGAGGQKQKTERKEKKKEERLNDVNNNGQLRIGTPPCVVGVF